tara:strand:+ start:1871 stop:2671 length:801 start_codon:yes stop_codon:yes gene_type:complete
MWLSSAVQIEVWKSNEWCRRGSGIIIRSESGHYLVTARHVVDEQFVDGPKGRSPFDKVRIINPAFISFGGGQEFVEWEADWKFDADENDLAATKIPGSDSGFYRAISADAILDEEQLNSLQIGHPLIMSGFPALGGIHDERPLMVGRQGVLSSHPLREISIKDTLGRNYFLLDSFAQSGFSGAPLFAFERPEFSVASPISFGAIKINGETVSEGGEPQRFTYPRIQAGLAGIVCGHFRSALDRQDGGHAGLSYCVAAHRATNLIDP